MRKVHYNSRKTELLKKENNRKLGLKNKKTGIKSTGGNKHFHRKKEEKTEVRKSIRTFFYMFMYKHKFGITVHLKY